MSTDAALRKRAIEPEVPFPPESISHDEVLRLGRQVVQAESRALTGLAKNLDDNFIAAVEWIYNLPGDLIITGMGKAGHIAQKLAATFASTGTRAHFLHPAEAIHGDLGRVQSGDLVLVLSQSGETAEILSLLPSFADFDVRIVAITASQESTLGCNADITIELGSLDEACALGLAPSTSTTAMLALGDAIALVVSRLRGFEAEDFARFHPGGSLGLKLSNIESHMRPLKDCRLASERATIREVLVTCTKPGRRSGAIMLVDQRGCLTGLFTDSDLARLIENRQDHALDAPVSQVMIKYPTTVTIGAKMNTAIELLADRKISELPVVDTEGCPQGLIDITDVMSLLPETTPAKTRKPGRPTVRIYSVDEYAD
ncbi:KpsF/GutQ family sugar-phosphate isomerase [Bythopirellula goksoeyrii]|uniref:Arabinose 5-phosphate isomerase KpsF n=1 Tax=Bythopirellula goksoeyrii TaxID=1400387 RepID=A0A5B9Q7B9_9BACT|nr:KpsF/GutQ family sugar-phosphate isomerase [Bythopirellula goksoeyrii]QEG33620.1 Arabinose 5-phosphate isomerase KpsF [Bythopirellula goksoeyrii]